MKLITFFLCISSLAFIHTITPDRALVRRAILLNKRSFTLDVIDPYFEELIVTRVRRQTPTFVSDDDEKVVDGSGFDEIEMPSGSAPSPTDWAWYRSQINFLDSIQYTPDLQDYHTPAFTDLAHEIMEVVEEHLKRQLRGYFEATPLMFSMKNDDVIMLMDVGTCMTYSGNDITRELLSLVNAGMIGRFRVSDRGFSIKEIGIDTERRECESGPSLSSPEASPSLPSYTSSPKLHSSVSTSIGSLPGYKPTCSPDQATCKNLQCIPRTFVCDGHPDCLDGSDEPESCSDDRTECDPTEFLCERTGVCIQKIWRCDGDNDCPDGFDELNCPTASPNSRCAVTQFECRGPGGVCIPGSYRCDREEDCEDGSDEVGCSPPVVVYPPQRFINAKEGSTVVLHCEAVGIPDPVISWRVNWGNVSPPPRVTMESVNGRGTLTIRNVKLSDQGAYTCEALNPNGSVLGTPDAIVSVMKNTVVSTTQSPTIEPLPPCGPGEFDTSPNTSPICKPCYCFGVTDLCYSSDLEFGEIGIEFVEPDNDEGVKLEAADGIDGEPDTNQPITNSQIRVYPPAKELQLIDLSKRFLAAAHYWSLPAQFLGAKINSYGGTLTYSFSYNNSYHLDGAPTDHADVILNGNGKTLQHFYSGAPRGPVVKHTVNVKLEEEENWLTSDNTPATREDLMNVLSNLDSILLRTVYDTSMISTGLGDVTLEVALDSSVTSSDDVITPEPTGKKAIGVEECICPKGYEGLSCQECAVGFERIRTGPSIGKCVSEEQGDSPTVHCELGYTGPGCTECAPGYLPVNGRCELDIGNVCNPAGTAEVELDQECQCKESVKGNACDQCKPGYFYLSENNRDGCLPCVCMGVTKDCNSSTLTRSKIYLQQSDNLELVTAIMREVIQPVMFFGLSQIDDRALIVKAQLQELPNEIYYWSLPPRFKGNKLSSYGGSLSYLLTYVAGRQSLSVGRRDDVRIVGDGIAIYYFRNVYPAPGSETRFEIKLREDYWSRSSDGGLPVTRETMLHVLKNIRQFFVRISYATEVETVTIKSVHLDAASPDSDGNRALDVEECNCPRGYTGLSCEDCSEGYFRMESGPYSGTCQPCRCNGNSNTCDKNTGKCVDCLHYTTGNHCEVCEAGFYGDPESQVACRRCPCPAVAGRSDHGDISNCSMESNGQPVCDQCPLGYTGDRCDRCAPFFGFDASGYRCIPLDVTCDCDPIGSINSECDPTGQCTCKPSTTGKRCDQCKPGFFYMNVENPDGGCLPCFCMGLTNQCTSASYERNEITSEFASDFGGFALTQQTSRNPSVDEGFEVLDNGKTLSYPRLDLLPGAETYYWKLPEEYLGDKIVSYGGNLHYQVSFTTYGGGTSNNDPDVILIGNDITITSKVYDEIKIPLPSTEKEISVVLKEGHWRRANGQPATREHLLMVLADLESVLLRASFSSAILRTSISNVVMETASESMLMANPVYDVEHCECPNGYEGTSCEDCASGFTRFAGGIYLGLCHLCECNGHSDLCDSESGVCFSCRHHTTGNRCSECASGYYGDATRGTEHDCRPCACPGTGANSFSNSCRLMESTNSLVCTDCQEGYEGSRCERCAPGYEGDPSSGVRCVRRSRDLLQVSIVPRSVTAKKGSRFFLGCNVSLPIRISITWRRQGSNSQIPDGVFVSETARTLLFPNFQPSQVGTYYCVVRSLHYVETASAVVSLQREKPMIKVRVEEPRAVRVRVGSQVSFVCTATSKMPAYLVTWTKQGGRLPMPRVTDFEGILHIKNVQLSDSGTYICTGSNMYSTDRETATLMVLREDDGEMPKVVVTPQNQSVSEGEDAIFYCSASGYPTPTLHWIRGDGEPMPEDVHLVGSMLMIPSASARDQSLYRCRASNSLGFVEASATLEVVAREELPYVTVVTTEVDLTVGDNKDLKCVAAGGPRPTFQWHKEENSTPLLPDNVEQLGGILRITSASVANQGVYVCTARNSYGHHSGQIRVTVNEKIVEGKPICRTDPKEVTAYIGTNSTITCVVGGNPEPEVVWEMEDGTELDKNINVFGKKMFIHNVISSNAGKYVCVATNDKGTSRSKMTLQVVQKDLPKVVIEPSRHQTVTAGRQVSFTCLTPGQDDTDITWLRSGQKLFTGETYLSVGNSKLNFINISTNESGSYMCLASNVVGFKQVEVQVSVLQPPAIDISPARFINMAEGERLSLNCDVTGYPPPSVVWLNRTGPGSPRMLTNYRLQSNTYTIPSVHRTHAGTYYCRATNRAGNAHQRVMLKVHKSVKHSVPAVVIEPTVARGTEGSEIRIQCRATGSPKPTISWSKVDGDLPIDSEQLHEDLLIHKLSNATAGTYHCKASNFLGEDKQSIQVDIITLPSLKIEPESVFYLAPGESINISCLVSGGTEPVLLTWKQSSDFDEINQASSSILEVIDFNSELHAGVYTCSGVNEAGSTAATVTLRELEVPVVSVSPNHTTKLVGQPATFDCVASAGQSDISVSWQDLDKEGVTSGRISVHDGRLSFDDVRVADNGTYSCTASNRAGSSTAQASLTVQALPLAEITLQENKTKFVEGKTVSVICTGVGVPSPKIALFKDGELLELDSSGVYRINSLSLADSGQYKCNASNTAGSSKASLNLNVYSIPAITIDPSPVRIQSGKQLTLNCVGKGTPIPNITWSKLDGILSDDVIITGSRLIINKAGIANSGTYQCIANNSLVATNASVKVEIDAFLPFFAQTPLSYMSMRISDNAFYTAFNVTISFKARTRDGLLLYSYGSNADFISLSLSRGKLDFRFNVGSGPVVIRSASSIELNQWHTVTVSRLHRTGQLRLDSDRVIEGKSPGEFRGLELTSNLYIGGIPSSANLPPSLENLAFDLGFYGCISQLSVHEEMIDLGSSSDVTERYGVVRCRTCAAGEAQSPCTNQATCLETHQQQSGYFCNCRSGFVGKNCQFEESKLCVEESCGRHGVCDINLDTDLGYVCTCDHDYTGMRCMAAITTTTTPVTPILTMPFARGRELSRPLAMLANPGDRMKSSDRMSQGETAISVPISIQENSDALSFSQDSYAMSTTVRVTQRRRTDISLRVRRRSHADGLLLYSDNSPRGSAFLALSIRNNAIELRFNTGTGCCYGCWCTPLLPWDGGMARTAIQVHAINLIELGQGKVAAHFEPVVDANCRLVAPPPTRRTAIGGYPKVASYDMLDTAVLRAPPSAVGVGAWHTVRIVRKRNRGKLEVDGKVAARARASGPEELDLEGPLFIGGVKFWDGIEEKVNVRNGFSGCVERLRIDHSDVPLNELFTKKNTASCKRRSISNSESEQPSTERTRPLHAAKFSASSYASFASNAFEHDQAAEQISIKFKTVEPYGLILYHGEDLISALRKVSRLRHRRRNGGRRRARRMDYISLGVQGSYLDYSFDIGGGKGRARSRFPVSDGLWHTAVIVRRGSLALMWMDDMPIPVAIQSSGSRTVPTTPGRVYIGGSPDVIFATAGRYTSGFSGCLKDVRLTAISSTRATELGSSYLNDSSTQPLDFSRSGSIERTNLRTCVERNRDLK